ncbi:hypothetical protein BD414DRAFT_516875 [Trametes punicea]|nr:hypothetical protein BD414DRAFT_516875 [Trametes punicea]
MAAARPKLAVVPSGAERAWGTAGSTLSAASSFLDLRSSIDGPRAPAATTKGKATAGAQPHVKKMRRKVALLSGIHLNLPSSPVAGPSSPGSSREMAWTFTAEWNSTHDEIVFSEVENASSSSSSSSSSSRFIASPVPFDVNEDEILELDVLSPPPVTTSSPQFSDMQSSSSYFADSPASPAVSDIFDFYTHTPSALSSHHDHKGSVSPAPSSPLSSTRMPPPSYTDSRHDQPIISVTFYEDPENQARGATPVVSKMSAFDGYISASSAFCRRRLPLPPASTPNRPRPLPPVPVRSSSAPASGLGSVAQQYPAGDDIRLQRASAAL